MLLIHATLGISKTSLEAGERVEGSTMDGRALTAGKRIGEDVGFWRGTVVW